MESIKYLIYYNLFADPPAMDTCPVSPNHTMWVKIAFALVFVLVGYLIGFWIGSIEKEERKW